MKFNTILKETGFDVREIRLLRHQDSRSERGRSPYELWRDDWDAFMLYQSVQSTNNRSKLNSLYWACFVVTPAGETLFVGIFRSIYKGISKEDMPKPHAAGMDLAGTVDVYDLTFEESLQDLVGKLIIDWGAGTRAWIQRADNQNKEVIEIRKEFQEPEFPGFLDFQEQLSRLERIPVGWKTALRSTRGVYLLTCAKTNEQYVGSASGQNGFWQRWLDYAQSGHGGDVMLKSRPKSDYYVSILEVAGSNAAPEDILKMETRWKLKLRSRNAGLNRN